MRKKIKYFLFISLITYIVLEVTCFVFIKTGYIKTSLPSFKFSFTEKKYPYHIADINPIWGAWHYKERYQIKKECFNVTYNINSFGARDAERQKTSADTGRVIVLGDSFIEGYGVEEKDRISNQLEKKLQKQFLNFGCSTIGTSQEYLIYKNLADSFTHSALLIGLLPFNDFINDDIKLWQEGFENYIRYRPYFTGDYPNYNITYKCSSFIETNFNKEGFIKRNNTPKKVIARFLRAYTYWFNVLDYFLYYKPQYKFYENKYSGFVHFTLEQFNRFTFLLKQIKTIAGEKRVILFTIPTESEITRYKSENKNLLGIQLSKFCAGQNIEFIDLLPVFAREKDISKFYLTCDPHWSAEGNKLAADTLLGLFK